MTKRVAIIGAGISGLAAAYSLEKKNSSKLPLQIDLIDKRDRVGGNIVTAREGGLTIEGGPDCVFSEKPAALKLCEELGLSERLLKTNPSRKGAQVYFNGRLHDLPEGVMLMVPTMIKPMLFSTLLSFPGKLRIGMELFVPQKKDNKEETLGGFVTRRFGKELLDKIAEPLVAGIHAGNPDTMSINASFPRFVDLEREYGSLIKGMLAKRKKIAAITKGKKPKYTMFMTLKNGLAELTGGLAEKLSGTEVLLNREAVKIVKKGEKYGLLFDNGESREYDALIVSSPAYEASKIVSTLAPEISDELSEIPYVSTATVSLAFKKSDIGSLPEGFGFIVPKVSGRKIMAATYTSLKFGERASEDTFLVRVFVGGASNGRLVFLNDSEMVKMVREELKEIVGIDADPEFSKVYRWDKGMPQYVVGHMDRVARIEKKASAHPGLFFSGSAYKGIGISDCIVAAGEAAELAYNYLKAQNPSASYFNENTLI